MRYRIRRLLSGIALAAMAAGIAVAQDAPNSLSSMEAAHGWKLLFDGRSLNGWEPHVAGDWRVEDGAIVCPGTTAGWFGTSQSFSDFALKLEFRGFEKVNSGVFLRSKKEGQPHITG